MKVHFIAIGGAIMHNLAIALKEKGYQVSGSDDVIFDPSKTLLANHGLLPESFGFFPDKIDKSIDVIILGMHAKMDNPELTKSMELGLNVFSFPEFIYEQSKNKIRVVIAGSHGKTTITSMIMHVLQYCKLDFDFMCGSSVAGFKNNVRLSDAPIIILEGDEYLTSALQPEPKFKYYKGSIALLSGIEWDHINVFPTIENYFSQFQKLVESLEPNASLIYFEEDVLIQKLVQHPRQSIHYIPYHTPNYSLIGEKTALHFDGTTKTMEVFGKHNMQNIEGARKVCELLNINHTQFYDAISSFSGAGKRLETIRKDENTILFKDFAHSPSKLMATVSSAKEQFPNRKLIACMELHTFSSLKKEFLPQYANTMNMADIPIIFINDETIKQKGGAGFTEAEIRDGFNNQKIKLFKDKSSLENYLYEFNRKQTVFLLMSSGNFGGLDLNDLAYKIFNDYRLEKKEEIQKEIIKNSTLTEETFKNIHIVIPESLAGTLRLLHISGLFTSIIGPLYFYNLKEEIIQEEAKKVINFQGSLLIIGIVLYYLGDFLCGIPYLILMIYGLLDIVYSVINFIHANNNKPAKYPTHFKILK